MGSAWLKWGFARLPRRWVVEQGPEGAPTEVAGFHRLARDWEGLLQTLAGLRCLAFDPPDPMLHLFQDSKCATRPRWG